MKPDMDPQAAKQAIIQSCSEIEVLLENLFEELTTMDQVRTAIACLRRSLAGSLTYQDVMSTDHALRLLFRYYD